MGIGIKAQDEEEIVRAELLDEAKSVEVISG
jgi:hypothetical protein